jgi:adenosylcobinamide-GDP ribazoletransferase
MKDPHAGSMGIISLVLILLVKFSAITAILINAQYYLLLAPPVLARTSSVLLLLTTPYVRKEGIGEKLAAHMPKKKVWSVCLLTTLALLTINPVLILIAVASCLGIFLLWRYFLMRRLGGCTGDTLGALIEATEMLTLVILALF